MQRSHTIHLDARGETFRLGQSPDARAYEDQQRLASSRRIDPKLQRLIKVRDLAQKAKERIDAAAGTGKRLSLADKRRAKKGGVHSPFSKAMNAAERVWQYEQRLLKK
jgi:hypothetical protein